MKNYVRYESVSILNSDSAFFSAFIFSLFEKAKGSGNNNSKVVTVKRIACIFFTL